MKVLFSGGDALVASLNGMEIVSQSLNYQTVFPGSDQVFECFKLCHLLERNFLFEFEESLQKSFVEKKKIGCAHLALDLETGACDSLAEKYVY